MYLYSTVPSIGLEGQPFGLAPYSLISLRNCSKGAIRYEIREVFPGHFGAQATVRVADLTAWTGPVTVNAGFYLEKLTVHSQTLSGSNFVKIGARPLSGLMTTCSMPIQGHCALQFSTKFFVYLRRDHILGPKWGVQLQ